MKRILCLITVGLFALIVWLSAPSTIEPKETETEALSITDTNVGDLSAAVLVHENEMAAVYVYDGQVGLMDAPEGVRLSTQMLKAFLYQASHLEAAKVFDTHEAWREYGLEAPYATLILMGRDDSRQRIYIGNETAYGQGRYVRRGNDERLYILDGIGAEMMTYGPNDFRDIQIFPTITTQSIAQIKRLTIEHGDEKLHIRSMQQDGAVFFIMEEPFEAALSWQAVTEKLILPLAAVQKEKYISDSGMQTMKAFDCADGYTLEVELSDQLYRIFLTPTEDGQSMYCAREGEPDIIQVKKNEVDFLNLTALDLMDSSLYTKKAADVEAVTVSTETLHGTLSIQGQGEQLCSFSEYQFFNQAETIRLYRQLTMLPPAQRLDGTVDLSNAPLITLSFELRDGTEDIVRCIPISDGYCAVMINDTASFTTYTSTVREIINAAQELFKAN